MYTADQIKALKPNLSDGSCKTYASELNHLSRADPMFHLGDLSKLIVYFSTLKCKRRKTCISALLLLFPQHELLKKLMDEAGVEDTLNNNRQQLTESQKEAWLSWESIIMRREKLGNLCSPYWTKLNISSLEFQLLQDYVIVCLFTMMPPRRCLDYCFMRNGPPVDENGFIVEDNKPYFIFNKYKTVKAYGSQKFLINEQLWNIIREWSQIQQQRGSEYLLSAYNGTPFLPSKMTRTLSRIFEVKGFGVNILRHSFVSDTILNGMPFLSDLQQTAEMLGHSPDETVLYKKHN